MKKGTRVSYSWKDGIHTIAGTGEVLSEPDDRDRVQVACDPLPPEARHFVILCTTSWLTPLPESLNGDAGGTWSPTSSIVIGTRIA